MAFSDSRNERDRAETGRNSSNHGGGDAKAAAQRNMDAMAARNSVAGVRPGTRPSFQPRRTPNPTPSYDLTPKNVLGALGMTPMGPMSAVGALAGALGVPGFRPDFEGYRGNVQGPGDYDPRNQALLSRPKMGVQGIQAAGVSKPVTQQPTIPGMTPLNVQAAMLGGPVPGLQDYSVQLPSYSYFGTPPAQQRPMGNGMAPVGQPAMFGGMRPGMPRRG